ncbi:MAG: hypothetical protein LAO19_21715 [Acidobacteriia bacterium]|nr:hypothetical protein [Terriglobia bacterium]
MRIDHTHKGWLIASLATFGVSALVYEVNRGAATTGASMGGTRLGLGFGVIGFAFMIFAGLLGARKKVPVWRVGRAQTWMRGHLWLGLLSLPILLLHSGFRYGHGLTAVVMTLLIIVVASGIFGAALQHYMPRVMTREVTMETIYEEIGHVRAQLLEEAEELIAKATAVPEKAAAAGAGDPPAASTATVAVLDGASPLRNFFDKELKPFLEKPGARGSALGDAAQARSAFVQLRTLVPPALHGAVDDLENICEEERQLTLQSRLHLWLHGWLLLHIPVSLALLLLGAMHAFMALRY